MTGTEVRGPCPVCGGSLTELFLLREGVPVHQNLVVRDMAVAKDSQRGSLAMYFCGACGFVFNGSYEGSRMRYGETYDNRQSCSACFAGYVDDLARYLVNEKGVRNKRIVEVGCGKGDFLKRLIALDAGNTGYGFDPSYEGEEVLCDGRLQFRRCFYGPDEGEIGADVVICRHVIEHVPEPMTLLGAIRAAIGAAEHPLIVFETPCVEWILHNRVIWDFFYEHCSLFTAGSLGFALRRAGFEVKELRHTFNGQYLWAEATDGSVGADVPCDPGAVPDLAGKFRKAEQGVIESWRRKIEELVGRGRVALWGAGAKGVTLANLVDPDVTLIDCVVDINPGKQGGYVPGTGHPIVDWRDLPERNVRSAILMNPNYHDEIRAMLLENHINIHLIC